MSDLITIKNLDALFQLRKKLKESMQLLDVLNEENGFFGFYKQVFCQSIFDFIYNKIRHPSRNILGEEGLSVPLDRKEIEEKIKKFKLNVWDDAGT